MPHFPTAHSLFQKEPTLHPHPNGKKNVFSPLDQCPHQTFKPIKKKPKTDHVAKNSGPTWKPTHRLFCGQATWKVGNMQGPLATSEVMDLLPKTSFFDRFDFPIQYKQDYRIVKIWDLVVCSITTVFIQPKWDKKYRLAPKWWALESREDRDPSNMAILGIYV